MTNPTPIKVQTKVGSAGSIEAGVAKIEVKREESEAAKSLRLALKVSRLGHTYSMAQVLGIYPA